jgi:GDPmannose 4,6-dehydratase
MKVALITGISGQDGYHLSELLISKGYKVYGVLSGQRKSEDLPIVIKYPQITILSADLTDFVSLMNVISEADPDEIYNLGAISFVGLSFKQPELTADVTGLGILRILEAVRKLDKGRKIRIYQASSSEMFGKVRETPQKETTPFYPRSPYGVAKTFAHYTSVQYREAYNMYVSCGILFNHEGEHRGHEFVTRKITSNVAKIALGKQERFSLGNMQALRDWGYAGDYVEAMWLMLQHEKPDDFVIATGKAHSVQDFVLESLKLAGLEQDVEKYIDFDAAQIRPSEVDTLIGDSSKARLSLNWNPKVDFKGLVQKMLENDMRIESNR